MNKNFVLLTILLLGLAAAEITQEQKDMNLCNCVDHPFIAKIKAFVKVMKLETDADAIAGLAPFEEGSTATNSAEITADIPEANHLVGEYSCCTDKTFFLFKKIRKLISKKSENEPTMAERLLFAAPKLVKNCLKESGKEVPETSRDFLAKYKEEGTDGLTGFEIFKALVKARAGLIRNFQNRLTGVLQGLCLSPCTAGDNINDETGAVLISKESDDANKADFEAKLADLKAALAKVKEAIKFFFETIGGEECKDISAEIKKKIEDDTENGTTRQRKIGPKPEVNREDSEATAASGDNLDLKPEDRSLDVNLDGKVPDNEERKAKLEAFEKKQEDKLKEKKDKLAEAEGKRPKINKDEVKEALEAAKQSGCKLPCNVCNNDQGVVDATTCQSCIYPVSALVTSGDKWVCMDANKAEELCNKVKGTWTDDQEVQLKKCVAPAPTTDPTSTECPIIAVGCAKCLGGVCTECKEGHFLEETKKVCIRNCVANQDMCTTCDAANQFCTTCADGHTLDERKKCIKTFTCEAGKLGCQTCSQANTKECETCDDSHVKSPVGGKCFPKCVNGEKGCVTCDANKPEKCTTCADTHVKDPVGRCVPKPSRRLLAEEGEIQTEVSEQGGINGNVSDPDDTEMQLNGVSENGDCINADDCKASENTFNSDGTVVESKVNDNSSSSVAEESDNSTLVQASLALLVVVANLL